MAYQIGLNSACTPRTKGKVVFPCSLFIGMTFDQGGKAAVFHQPLGLRIKDRHRLNAEIALINNEQNPITNGIDEKLGRVVSKVAFC